MLGSHLSIAGGMVNALLEARRLKFDTVQVFTKNQRQWRVPPLKEKDCDDWLDELGRLGWMDRTVSHASYLANLASPDAELWEKSVKLMRTELDRCEALSIRYLVFHPGAHVGTGGPGGADARAGMKRIGKAIRRLLKETAGDSTILCLENTAGAGTTLGRTFEELAQIARCAGMTGETPVPPGKEKGKKKKKKEKGSEKGKGEERGSSADRIGFCFDTCHALAAGYDLTTPQGVQSVFEAFDRTLGLERLRVMHLNDSKGALGSRVDRHTHIGEGAVGLSAFRYIMNTPDFQDVPKILETPKGQTPKGTPWDTINRRRLLRLVAKAPLAGAR